MANTPLRPVVRILEVREPPSAATGTGSVGVDAARGSSPNAAEGIATIGVVDVRSGYAYIPVIASFSCHPLQLSNGFNITSLSAPLHTSNTDNIPEREPRNSNPFAKSRWKLVTLRKFAGGQRTMVLSRGGERGELRMLDADTLGSGKR